MARNPARLWVECRTTLLDVYIPGLLLGLPAPENPVGQILDSAEYLMMQRHSQGELGVECPTVVAVSQVRNKRYQLALYCEAPGSWHRLPDAAGVYEFPASSQLLRRLTPYLRLALAVMAVRSR